jgi:hypothetical protein
MQVVVNNRLLEKYEMEEIAMYDGFDDATDMAKWFIDKAPNGFKGKLIHWTKKKY